MAEKPQSAMLQTFLDEHLQLNRRIADLCKWWSELDQLGTPKFGEMAFRVEELRNLLAEHFAEEERGGYLASALEVAPRFAAQSAELCRQHRQFLDRLDDLIARARAAEPPSGLWRAARSEIQELLADLDHHERSENAIVQGAFEDDVGTED
jgi:iron-sulfur cluster repair protein YtfE (RIC family)